ncbi:hypothetical protein TKK_0002785 [Trichogramma kaykai]
MQRCPYLSEMKERLLSQPTPNDSLDNETTTANVTTLANNKDSSSIASATAAMQNNSRKNSVKANSNGPGGIPEPPEMPPDSLIGTVVKLNSDGYGSHTSPAHARQPLVPQNSNNQHLSLVPMHLARRNSNVPKNAK